MQSNMLNELQNAGVDVAGTLGYIGIEESVYKEFLYKFKEDKNYSELKRCLEMNDYESAFDYAHTLKGVAGNLGMKQLYKYMDDMVSVFRKQKEGDPKKIFNDAEVQYLKIYGIIEKNISER